MSAEAGITHPVASYANALPPPGERGGEEPGNRGLLEMPIHEHHL